MAAVEIRNVRKAFGPVEVLHGVSVNIAESEFVVLVRPSGCGKSTLLRMLAGLENITAGESPSVGSLPVAIFYSFFVDYYVSSPTGAVKE